MLKKLFSRKRHITTPKNVTIAPQRMNFGFKGAPPYWFDNEPVQTHLMNALSLTFPVGERFFVDSVRALRNQADTPELKQQISGFIGQEAMHSLEHDTFNKMLSAMGYQEEAEGGQNLAQKLIAGGRKSMTPRQQLATTAALEHITAIMAQWLLSDRGVIDRIDPSVRDLWLWHAIEETEHKAVCVRPDAGSNRRRLSGAGAGVGACHLVSDDVCFPIYLRFFAQRRAP